jgi:cytochrome P450
MIHRLHLDKVLFHRIASGRERYMAYSKSQAVERMKMGSDADRRDFFYYLLKAKDPETGAGFATPELWGESNLLIIAGSDTTSTALAGAFFYLVHNSYALKKATQEIRTAFTDVEEIHAGPQLSACNYLRAVLDEAMRLSPPVSGLLPREVLAGGITIDGEHIPAGVVVGTPHYTIHHNPAYFRDPFSFIPERWIPGSAPNITATTVAAARGAFCPFSIGPRGCIGKGMAYTELSTALARVLWMYDMRLAPGARIGEGNINAEYGRRIVGEFQLLDTFTSKKDGPVVQFRRR